MSFSNLDMSKVSTTLNTWGDNFIRNTQAGFNRLGPKDWIRLIAVVGAYALIIRPFLVKLGVRIQTKSHEDEQKVAEEEARLNANHLRGKVAIPGVDSDSEDEADGQAGAASGQTRSGQWGRTARLRQRKIVRKAMEMQQNHALANESDEELNELLQD